MNAMLHGTLGKFLSCTAATLLPRSPYLTMLKIYGHSILMGEIMGSDKIRTVGCCSACVLSLHLISITRLGYCMPIVETLAPFRLTL